MLSPSRNLPSMRSSGIPNWPQKSLRKPRETVVNRRPRERLSITENCSAERIGCVKRPDERERSEGDAIGLAREHRQQLLGPGIATLGRPVPVRHDHGMESGPLGQKAFLDHGVHRVGDRIATARLVVGVDHIADAHGGSGALPYQPFGLSFRDTVEDRWLAPGASIETSEEFTCRARVSKRRRRILRRDGARSASCSTARPHAPRARRRCRSRPASSHTASSPPKPSSRPVG